MTFLKAAVVQASPVAGDTSATVEKTVRLIHTCGKSEAKVAVFPEAFIGGYPKGANFNIYIGARTPEGREEFKSYHEQAISVPGPETDLLCDAAREAGIYAAVGVIERVAGTLYCTVIFLSPEGKLVSRHRKTMPTAAERLCWGFGDGSTLSTVETPWGNMGSVICWENYMPMLRMAMYEKNVSLYCAPTADDRDSWAATMQHIALEGRCFVLSSCQYLTRKDFPDYMQNMLGDDPDQTLMRGGSLIVSPLGKVLAGPVWEEETILYADLDMEEVIRGKFDFDVAGHYARPDIFQLLVDERPNLPVGKVSS
ncbi:MAG: carbon-nitrogen hydrolase family protein [Pseudomonadota bacterium]